MIDLDENVKIEYFERAPSAERPYIIETQQNFAIIYFLSGIEARRCQSDFKAKWPVLSKPLVNLPVEKLPESNWLLKQLGNLLPLLVV